MGNTVGSANTNFCNFFSNEKDAYILGLFCADSYWWASSVGLSNTDPDLIERFRKFLETHFPKNRIKFNRNHLFVNSRPLLKEFRKAQISLENLKRPNVIKAYFAGRFDGDGSINNNLRSDCRIVYGRKSEAEKDKEILERIGIDNVKVYYYKTAKTFCLYISRYEAKKFLESIVSYSVKLQKLVFAPCRDLTLVRAKRV
ncbi:MAG: LAGLIDADG family homing endonuclease [Patescibacteria group bacterium]|nr:LAGLIDADG family homing endonuclease [Patescibacteria group bacterium]